MMNFMGGLGRALSGMQMHANAAPITSPGIMGPSQMMYMPGAQQQPGMGGLGHALMQHGQQGGMGEEQLLSLLQGIRAR